MQRPHLIATSSVAVLAAFAGVNAPAQALLGAGPAAEAPAEVTADQGASPTASSASPQVQKKDARPSGLAWDSGVTSATPAAFIKERQRPADVITVFPPTKDWKTLNSSAWMSSTAIPSDFTGTLSVGLPLFPTTAPSRRPRRAATTRSGASSGRRWRRSIRPPTCGSATTTTRT